MEISDKKIISGVLFYVLLAVVLVSLFPVPPARAQTYYTYTFHAPYYEDGGVANANISLAVLWVNGTTLRFDMSGDGVTANTTSFTSEYMAYQVLWNASSALNYTRVIDFAGETEEEYIFYIPSPQVPSGIYSFSVADFASMRNPWIQSSISTNGTDSNVVERRNLNATDTVSFVMAQYGTYTITIGCDAGSFTQLFTAENSFYTNIPVLAGVFPLTNSTVPTFSASRLNSSLIGISYSDPSENTDWLSVNITHINGASTIYDYFTNNTGSSQSILWNLAASSRAYKVEGIASINGELTTWKVTVAKAPLTNPWEGVFDWLGQEIPTLPYYTTGYPDGMTTEQIGQLVAAVIITFFLCIGSFRSVGACCVLAWIVGGIMLALGWMGGTIYASLPMFGLAGFLSILIVVQEGKETVREI